MSPPLASGDALAARCAAIELLLIDVDGVLTDGVIVIDDNGVESKHFHVRDGGGLTLWHRAGKRSAILSGRSAPLVDRRARELGISRVIQGASDKGPPFRDLLQELGLDAGQVCYIGDDLADLPVLKAVGLAACPADAALEVRRAVHLVTNTPGGRGAVRDVVETILKSQNLWEGLLATFERPA